MRVELEDSHICDETGRYFWIEIIIYFFLLNVTHKEKKSKGAMNRNNRRGLFRTRLGMRFSNIGFYHAPYAEKPLLNPFLPLPQIYPTFASPEPIMASQSISSGRGHHASSSGSISTPETEITD